MMRNKYYFNFVCVVGLAVAGTGCSILNSGSNKVAGSSGTVTAERQVDASTAEATVLTPPKNTNQQSGKTAASKQQATAVKNKKDKDTSKEKQSANGSKKKIASVDVRADVPSDAGVVQSVTNESVAEYGVATLPADFSIDGEWTVYSVRGNVVTGEERPYINFDLSAKRFYGSNGCNYINGDIDMTGADRQLRLDNMITTMKLCEEAQFEYLINLALSDVRSFDVRYKAPITFLDLKSLSGQTIMVLRRHNMDYLNGAWKIVGLNGTPVDVEATGEEEPTMTINITDLLIHGTTGCNIFNGSVFIDPDKANSLQFISIATTRRGCPPNSRETEFLLALESVETARSVGKDEIVMYSTSGHELFKLKRMELRQEDE